MRLQEGTLLGVEGASRVEQIEWNPRFPYVVQQRGEAKIQELRPGEPEPPP
jgi:hypothetical protein